MNEYNCRPRLGNALRIFNNSESGARHVCMTVVYGPSTLEFPNHGVGLDIELVNENVQPPTPGVYVYQENKLKEHVAAPNYAPKIGWR